MSFSVGDVVRLKSGGAAMTVISVIEAAGGYVICEWMNHLSQIESRAFSNACVELVETESEDPCDMDEDSTEPTVTEAIDLYWDMIDHTVGTRRRDEFEQDLAEIITAILYEEGYEVNRRASNGPVCNALTLALNYICQTNRLQGVLIEQLDKMFDEGDPSR